MAKNQAAWLLEKGRSLEVQDAEMPTPGPNELVVKNKAVAINPIDVAQQSIGIFLEKFPVVLGHDIAGEVVQIGSSVTKFKQGDRILAHAWQMITQNPQDSGFALYTKVNAGVAALLPTKISFMDAVVLPLSLDTATAALYQAGPSLGLPWPSANPKPSASVVVVYGGSSSIGLSASQLAVASGSRVISIAGTSNHALCKEAGASTTLDYKGPNLVSDVVGAVGQDKLLGIFDCIANETTFSHDFAILEKFGGGRIAASQSPPEKLPANVLAQQVMGVGDFAFPLWENFVGQALESGQLKCLPNSVIVGKGLESIQKALDKYAAGGVSGQKLVVEL